MGSGVGVGFQGWGSEFRAGVGVQGRVRRRVPPCDEGLLPTRGGAARRGDLRLRLLLPLGDAHDAACDEEEPLA